MKGLVIALCLLALPGCTTFVPVVDVSKVPKETLQEAYRIKAYETTASTNYPEISEYLGNITAYSCKFMMWDPPASKGDALIQLRLKALELKADGIIDLTYDSRGTDAFGTNCWQSVQASGVAVKMKRVSEAK